MEIFNIYETVKNSFMVINFLQLKTPEALYTSLTWQKLLVACAVAFGVWLALFILHGIGIAEMAKRRGIDKRWMAFVPFVNLYYMEKLTGDCSVFGQRMRHAGMFAMIAQIVNAFLCLAYIFAECYLYYTHGAPVYSNGVLMWADLLGFARIAYAFYNICYYLISITSLAYTVLIFILFLGLFRQYEPKASYLLSFLVAFIPLSRYIIVYVLRKRKAIDYDTYVRAKREEYVRRQQAQGGYPNGPYYGGSPFGTPNAGRPQQGPSSTQAQSPKEDPFAEFGGDEDRDGKGQKSPFSEEKGKDEWFS